MKIYPYSLITFGGRRICIGKQGENLATRIDVDVTPWKTEYPTGIISLFVVPPVGNGYLAAIEAHENTVMWPIRDTDTAYAGSGKAELILKDADGTVIKSVTAYTTCTPSVSAAEPSDPPEAIRPWAEQILDAIASGALAGIGIESLEQTTISTDDSGINVWTATLTDGSTYQFEVRNGQRGADGAPGEKGEKGEKGDTGDIGALTINGKKPDGSGAVTLTANDLGAATAEEVSQLKDDLSAITPDDTVVDGKPWTSKKTVDSLCMPFEATGNPVQVYPVEGYPLGVKVNWEPVQAGEGDPSPDNIRPIIGRDAVSVTRCEENLLNISQLKPEGYNLAGINTLKPNTTYTFKPVSCRGINFAVFLTDNIVPSQTTKQLNLTRAYIAEGESATFTTPSNADSYSVMWLAGSKSGINQVYPNVQFMLVAGTTAPTTYTPYIGQTNTLTLPETVYGGTLDVETGVVTVNKRVTIADGTVNKFNGGQTWGLPPRSFPGIIESYWENKFIISSHFKGNLFSSNKAYEFVFTTNEKMAGLFDTVDDLNAYLVEQNAAGTPVTFVYKLTTPYTIQLSTQQIAALIGVNTLYTDAGTLTVTGREDPRHTIVTLTDRIAALESAAAGV